MGRSILMMNCFRNLILLLLQSIQVLANHEEEIMERLHTAMKNPHVNMIAHPTGRIIGQRDGYNPDIPQLISGRRNTAKFLN